jgi:MoxR-like ATPase
MKDKIQEFYDYCDSFNSLFVSRNREIKQLMYAVLCKDHVLFVGGAGVAKSLLAKYFFSGFSGKIFKQQFTAFMDETYLFGPQDIDALKKGLIIHNVKDSLVDSEFAILDEFFNANEETIVACNGPLNEREFSRNGQQVKSPLITAVMTTNQHR